MEGALAYHLHVETVRVIIDVPAEVAAGAPALALGEEARLLLVLERFRRGELTAARAARLLGRGRIEFIELCAQHDVPVIRYDAADLRQELADIRARGH